MVGLPNVGKSSLINSLKRSKACHVGSTPGVTKAMQEVQLDSKIKLLDSPGVVLASGLKNDASVALRNAIKVDTMDDPITPVEAILQRCPKEQMCLQYSIASYDTIHEFLAYVAKKIGKLSKGGVPNSNMAARLVLNDWNNGKIKYFTHPPETETKSTHVSAEIVTEFAKEFSLQDLDRMDQDDLSDLPAVLPSETMKIDTSGMLENVKQEENMDLEGSEEEETESEDDENENIGQLSKRTAMLVEAKKAKNGPELPKFQAEGLAKLKKSAKMREKKEKKDRRRRDKVATELSNDLENALEALGGSNAKNEKYDFDKDFEM